MKKAIILHGLASEKEYYNPNIPSSSNHHWLPWLQKQLVVNGYAAVTPEVPFVYRLNWQDWVKEVERFDIDEDTDIVAHSCGGGFWLRYLSENPRIKVGKVILVAPWIDVEKQYSETFFDFKIDSRLATRTKGVTIFHSDNDGTAIQTSLKKITESVQNVNVKLFHNYGHFILRSMGTTEFPELLETVLAAESSS